MLVSLGAKGNRLPGQIRLVTCTKPKKGKSATVKVTTAKFVREGFSYPAASAKRTFTRH